MDNQDELVTNALQSIVVRLGEAPVEPGEVPYGYRRSMLVAWSTSKNGPGLLQRRMIRSRWNSNRAAI